MNAIFKKEIKGAFNTLIAPIFIAVVLCVMGSFLVMDQMKAGEPQFEHTVFKAAFWSLLIVAVLTMRTLSEERRAKTDQLLYYLPITSGSIIMGKFAAMAVIFFIPCAIISVYPLVLSGSVEGGSANLLFTYSTIIGYFLLGCAVIALSMFISSLTDNQLISAIISLCAFAALYFLGLYADSLPGDKWMGLLVVVILCLGASVIVYVATKSYTAFLIVAVVLTGAAFAVYFLKGELYEGLLSKIVSSVCIFLPLEKVATVVNAKELIDWTPYVYYISITALFLFLSVQSFEKRRWN